MKPNLLLLHGAIGSEDQLIPLKKHLSDSFNCYSLNFPGHGGRSFEKSFSIATFADSVLRFMEKEKFDKIDIFGYSMGGYVALYLAKIRPEKVGKIMTLGTKFHWSPQVAENETLMLQPKKIQQKIPAFADALAKRHAPLDWMEVLSRTADMMTQMGKDNPLKKEDYGLIQHQVNIGLADSDEMVTLEETEAVVRYLPIRYPKKFNIPKMENHSTKSSNALCFVDLKYTNPATNP